MSNQLNNSTSLVHITRTCSICGVSLADNEIDFCITCEYSSDNKVLDKFKREA